jgi:hypothetical protein
MLVFDYKALGLRYVIVFLLLSFALVALLVTCFLQIRRESLMPKALRDGFEADLDAKDFQQAYDLGQGRRFLSRPCPRGRNGQAPIRPLRRHGGDERVLKTKRR